jgi:hypothetical protein
MVLSTERIIVMEQSKYEDPKEIANIRKHMLWHKAWLDDGASAVDAAEYTNVVSYTLPFWVFDSIYHALDDGDSHSKALAQILFGATPGLEDVAHLIDPDIDEPK